MKEKFVKYETPVTEFFNCESEGVLCVSGGLENWGPEEDLQ